MTLRVLLVIRPATGGIRQHVITLSRQLKRKDVAVSFAAPQDLLNTLPKDLTELPKYPVDISSAFSPVKDLAAARTLTAVIGRGFDLIHSQGLRAGMVTSMSLATKHVPHIVTFHNLLSDGFATRSALTLIASCSQGFIAVSPNIASGLSTMASRVPRMVIPNGIPIADFEVRSPVLDQLFELDKNRSVVGCVARLSPEKGVDFLLSAAKMLPEVQFIIAGEGPDAESLMNLAPSNVEFLGRVDKTRDVYHAADVLVIPSRSEGQGIVALEAMAASCPVIASDAGGLSTMLTDEQTALLVPVGDVSLLASSIQRLVRGRDMRARLIHNGRELVLRKYSDDRMATSTIDFYGTVLHPG